MVNLTTEDIAKHCGEPNGSADHLTDAEIARALGAEPILLACAKLLTARHGRLVSRADLALRVEASPVLQEILEAAGAAFDQRVLALADGLRRRAEKRQARRAVDDVDAADGAEADQGLDSARISSSHVSPRARANMRFYPNDALCGARTRRGTACRRIVEPGARRCRLHGGLSTGPRTADGRKRIGDAQRARWERYRKERGR